MTMSPQELALLHKEQGYLIEGDMPTFRETQRKRLRIQYTRELRKAKEGLALLNA